MQATDDKSITCSFCFKASHSLDVVVKSAEANICSECIAVCVEIIMDQRTEAQELIEKALKTGRGAGKIAKK